MHPIMTNIRPRVATQLYEPSPIDPSQLTVALSQALQANGITAFSNVHIIRMGGQQFYQVLVDAAHNDIRYISTVSGRQLANGDQLYAQFLARKFLTGSGNTVAPEPQALSDHDCCMSAALNILNSKGAAILSVEKVNDFKGEYSYINRLLPVYKVGFNRPDGIRIYVETASGSYAYAVDNKRAVFDKIFGLLHTWNWMNAMGKTKYFIMVLVTALALLTTIMGLYIFFTTKSKKAGSPASKARRSHRYTSLAASLFTLMFSFSGGFHALKALWPQQQHSVVAHTFMPTGVDIDFSKMMALTKGDSISGLSLCSIHKRNYWRIQLSDKKKAANGRSDLMKNKSVRYRPPLYVEAANGVLLSGGDSLYARYLAQAFNQNKGAAINRVSLVTKFTNEYGFINKRLPVWRVSYNTRGNQHLYIDTKAGVLAARVDDNDMAEGYSFALLHKHHFMDWAGKATGDVSTMIAAGLQVLLVIVGIFLFIRTRKRTRIGNTTAAQTRGQTKAEGSASRFYGNYNTQAVQAQKQSKDDNYSGHNQL